jgi:transposase InsO family protein
MESFFATLKKEKLYKMNTVKMTTADVKSVIFRYIHYYNRRRIYFTNGGYPPTVFRTIFYAGIRAA